MSALRKKISDMEGQLPQLQETKKTAVTGECYLYIKHTSTYYISMMQVVYLSTS